MTFRLLLKICLTAVVLIQLSSASYAMSAMPFAMADMERNEMSHSQMQDEHTDHQGHGDEHKQENCCATPICGAIAFNDLSYINDQPITSFFRPDNFRWQGLTLNEKTKPPRFS